MGKLLNMSSINHDEIRHRILEILYEFEQENPLIVGGLSRDKMKEILHISEEKMDFNMVYLEQKGLLTLFKGIGTWFHARITAFGIDVIGDKEKFSEQFPFIQTNIQEIHGDVHGILVQAVESQVVSFNQQITTAFQQARNITETKEDIRPTLREEVKKYLNLLEEELKRKEPDAGKIQMLWKWLRRNANWVVPTLTQVVLEGLKMALGLLGQA